jgi:hypothetical protein
MNNEFERIWKGADVALFEVLSRHLTGRIDVNHVNRSPDLNPGPPEYDAGMPSTDRDVRFIKMNCIEMVALLI